MSSLTGQDFGDGNALVLGLVRQHWAGNHVANGVDAVNRALELAVDAHATALIERHADQIKAQPFGERLATDRDQRHVSIEQFHVAALGRFDPNLERTIGFLVDAGDLAREAELNALLLQHALELARHFAVHAGQDAVEEFHHGHLRPKTCPDRTQFKPDHAGADHQQLARHLVERQCARGRHHGLFVNFDTGQIGRHRTRRNDNVLGFNGLRGARLWRHQHLAGRGNRADAAEHGDLVFLEQVVNAADIGIHRVGLVRHHLRQVDLGRRNINAELLESMGRFFEHFRGMQERLRGNAADVQARAAQRWPFLDHGDLHPQLRCTNCRDIAARPRADDGEVEYVCHGG